MASGGAVVVNEIDAEEMSGGDRRLKAKLLLTAHVCARVGPLLYSFHTRVPQTSSAKRIHSRSLGQARTLGPPLLCLPHSSRHYNRHYSRYASPFHCIAMTKRASRQDIQAAHKRFRMTPPPLPSSS